MIYKDKCLLIISGHFNEHIGANIGKTTILERSLNDHVVFKSWEKDFCFIRVNQIYHFIRKWLLLLSHKINSVHKGQYSFKYLCPMLVLVKNSNFVVSYWNFKSNRDIFQPIPSNFWNTWLVQRKGLIAYNPGNKLMAKLQKLRESSIS